MKIKGRIAEGENLERHSIFEHIVRIFSVPILNNLPKSTIQKMMRSSNKDAKTVVKHGGSTLALDAMYTGPQKRPLKKRMLRGLADIFWHNFVSQPRALRNRLLIVERHIEDELNERIEKGMKDIRVLNIGGGSSRALIHTLSKLKSKLTDVRVSIINIDKDKRAIEAGKKLASEFGLEKNFEWINDDARNIDNLVERESVDIVEMVGLLDYFDIQRAHAVLKNINGALKTGGFFIVANVYPNREMKFVERTGWPHMYYREPEDMHLLVRDAGFEGEINIIFEPLKIHIIAVTRK